tara:strand:+ start:95545 stop:96639 length:1095 start_codon:yes stop_codon:yes gene_type:complete
MNAKAHIHGLTAARGLAAWMVVLFHIRSGTPWLPGGVMAVVDKGYLAVDFFFLLSGFVIYLSTHEAMLESGARAIPAFLKRRAARIYPLYGTILALTILFAALLNATDRDASGYPWGELPLHIMMLQNWGFTSELTWNHPAWSISTEFAAYLIFPLIVIATPIARAPRWALVTGIAAAIGVMAAWLRSAGLADLGEDIPQFGLVRCLFEFSAGCMLCALWLRCADRRERMPVGIALLVLVGAGLAWSGDASRELWAFPAMAAAGIFLIAQGSRSGWQDRPSPVWRALVYLGEISYATYLVHYMLFIWFKIVAVEDAANIPPMQIALFLALTFIASVALYHGIEKPGRKLARRTQRAELEPIGAS